ncbi:MAG: hypothetical protein JNK26_00365 [Candidatus Doudnabacteria bacterium]|nr:hypothetical protein [Candidatus Doudnabacteria bacterium]
MSAKNYREISSALVWGLGLIGVGIVLLLNTTGTLSWDIWQTVVQFWPVALIIAGLNSVFGHRRLGAIVVPVLGLGMLGFAFFYSYITLPGNECCVIAPPAPGSSAQVSVPDSDKGVQVMNVELDVDSQKVAINETSSGSLFTLSGIIPQAELTTWLKSEVDGEVANILVKSPDNSKQVEGGVKVEIATRTAETAFDLKLSSSSLTLGLKDSQVKDFELNANSSSINITLDGTAAPTQTSRLVLNSSQLNIKLPKNVGFKVTYEANSSNVVFAGDEISGRGVYTSENYQDADFKWVVVLDANSSKVSFSFDADKATNL